VLGTELSENLTSVSYVLFACGFLVFILVLGRRVSRLVLDVKGVKATVETELVEPVRDVQRKMVAVESKVAETAAVTEQINTAVNHRQPHEPTLVGRVTNLESGQVKITELILAHVESTRQWQDTLVEKLGIEVQRVNNPEVP
jgi:hypothetical protein